MSVEANLLTALHESRDDRGFLLVSGHIDSTIVDISRRLIADYVSMEYLPAKVNDYTAIIVEATGNKTKLDPSLLRLAALTVGNLATDGSAHMHVIIEEEVSRETLQTFIGNDLPPELEVA